VLPHPTLLALLALAGILLTLHLGRAAPARVQDPATAKVSLTRHGIPQRWFAEEVTIVVDASVNELDPQARLAVERAFIEWLSTGSRLPNLVFAEGEGLKPSLKPDGISSIMYAPIDIDGHQDDLAITIGFADDVTGEINEVDIVINSTQPFAILNEADAPRTHNSCAGSVEPRLCAHQYDLQSVMTHEAGHFFGLAEDRDNSSATMFSCTSRCETHKRKLAGDDLASITSLYQVRGRATCDGASLAGARNPAAWAGCLLMTSIAALSWRRRRRSASGT
jgi:hypothetical protein